MASMALSPNEDFIWLERVFAAAVQCYENRECAVLANLADHAVATALRIDLLSNRQLLKGVAKNYGFHRLALQGVLTSRLALHRGPASEIGVSPYLHAGHSLGSAFRFVRRRSGLRVGRLSGLSDRRSP